MLLAFAYPFKIERPDAYDTLEKLPVWTMRRIDELLPIKPSGGRGLVY